ncbi:hypothetical protein SBV1_1770008 [Verrucomicrobia bacterium]|nr:hypothetical protein SBV1_1770008 [Verrucomicrobiota bacterium]
MFTLVTDIVSAPISIDYEPTTTSLVFSYNYDYGQPNNFALLDTNVAVTPWSGISNLMDEIQITTVKRSVNGFRLGDMYYGTGNPGQIGWRSADGMAWNTNWATLTNEPDILRGGLYVDQTGVFGYDLLAVTSDPTETLGQRDVWRIDSQGNSSRITSISGYILEAVITLTNDVHKWGPWAGRLMTGDEEQHLIYAVATNGVTTPFDLGISPEVMLLIPTNQDLYVADYYSSEILKVSRTWFTNFVGDLLIVQSGEYLPGSPLPTPGPQLFIVSWDAITTNFVTLDIGFPNVSDNFEGATFAPIDIPSQPLP